MAKKEEAQEWQEHFSRRPRGTQSTLDKPPSNGGAGILAEGTSLRLTCHTCFSFGPLVCNASPHPAPAVSPMVFLVLFLGVLFFVFKNMQFDYSSFIQGKTSHVVFLWKYIYYISIFFIFIFANLPKYSQLSWSGKRLAEGIRPLFFLPHRSGLSCCSRVLDEKKKEKILAKHERGLRLRLPLAPLLSLILPLLLPPLPAVQCHMPFSRPGLTST